MEMLPEWINNLTAEDLNFIKRFVLSSGSLKEMAKEYGVSYPTVRLRLDRLIDKIKMEDDVESSSYIKLIKRLALDDKLDFDTAKILIRAYREDEKK